MRILIQNGTVRARRRLTFGPMAVIIALLAFGTLLLAACGGGDGGKPADGTTLTGGAKQGATLNPCDLVTKAEAEDLLGGPVEDASAEKVGPFDSCFYSGAGLFEFVQLQVCRCLTGSQFDDSVKSGAEELDLGLKPVSGLGDKAYWMEGILWVQKGDQVFNVWVSSKEFFTADGEALGGEALEQKALPIHTEVAKRVLGRLP